MEKLKFNYINNDKEKLIENELKNALKIIGRRYFFDDLSFIVKEMINNANKANFKSVFYSLNNLNIASNEDYKSNINKFKEEVEADITKFFDQLSRLGLYIEVFFVVENNHFIISVINNRPLTNIERERIKAKYFEADKFGYINENLLSCVDTSEGAGLGIILIILMLKKIGLDNNYFKFIEHGNYTESKVLIPLTILEKREQVVIAEIAQKEIEEIPQLPENISLLQMKVDDPNSSFNDLANVIRKDASIIAELLKIVNSGYYLVMNKVKTVDEAIRIIGFDGIKNMVLAYKAKEILIDRYNIDIVKDQLDHSTEVALIACSIAKILGRKNNIDEIYTAAILHDIGKIIINSLNPNVLNQISNVCHKKGLNVNIVENFTEGFNHSIIGALLAEKWQFSENIISVIKYHHSPNDMKGNMSDIVNIVYLSNIIYYYKRNEFLYNNIELNVLLNFNITEEKALKELLSKIKI
ncbi:MAG: HDOD domain-containing protein [Spirochaetes bacterium]|nr:HDOD domain-containing protein [Spirochaetota bacterium]